MSLAEESNSVEIGIEAVLEAGSIPRVLLSAKNRQVCLLFTPVADGKFDRVVRSTQITTERTKTTEITVQYNDQVFVLQAH